MSTKDPRVLQPSRLQRSEGGLTLPVDNTPRLFQTDWNDMWRQFPIQSGEMESRSGHSLTAVSDQHVVLFGGFNDRYMNDVHMMNVGMCTRLGTA